MAERRNGRCPWPKAPRRLRAIRRAATAATEKWGIGGRKKTVGGPKPVTLPRLKFQGGEEEGK